VKSNDNDKLLAEQANIDLIVSTKAVKYDNATDELKN